MSCTYEAIRLFPGDHLEEHDTEAIDVDLRQPTPLQPCAPINVYMVTMVKTCVKIGVPFLCTSMRGTPQVRCS